MNRKALYRWEALGGDKRLLWLKYWWGPASANTLAYRQDDGSWVVVSPASGAPDGVYDEIASLGPVKALLAPNAFHNMGQAAWRARFPDALSFAPRGALGRLAGKTPGVPYVPLEEAGFRLGPARFLVPGGMKTPDALFSLPFSAGCCWWLGDQFSNNSKADQIWPFRILSRIVANGPGFFCNPKPGLVYVADKAAWAATMREALVARPPAVALCAHGDPVIEGVAGRAIGAIDRVVRP